MEMHITAPIMDLPIGLLSDILSRLPFDDVARCRSVRSSWNNLITEPYFAYLHCTRSSEYMYILHPEYDRQFHRFEDQIVKNFNLVGNMNSDQFKVREIRSPPDDDIAKGRILGSCNGLLCVATESDPCLPNLVYNPITKHCIPLPNFPEWSSHYHTYGFEFGFGFDQINKKHKVVVTYNREQDNRQTGVILTLGENTWRRLHMPGDVDSLVYYGELGFFNGAFCWVIAAGEGFCETHRLIFQGFLTMDISTENFDIIKFSTSLSLALPADFDVIKLGNSVALVGRDNKSFMSSTIQIWKILGANADGSCHYEYMTMDVPFKTRTSISCLTRFKLLCALNKDNNRFLLKARLVEPLPKERRRHHDLCNDEYWDHLVIYDMSKEEESEDSVTEVTKLLKLFNPIFSHQA